MKADNDSVKKRHPLSDDDELIIYSSYQQRCGSSVVRIVRCFVVADFVEDQSFKLARREGFNHSCRTTPGFTSGSWFRRRRCMHLRPASPDRRVDRHQNGQGGRLVIIKLPRRTQAVVPADNDKRTAQTSHCRLFANPNPRKF
jgi:hypothetical protein